MHAFLHWQTRTVVQCFIYNYKHWHKGQTSLENKTGITADLQVMTAKPRLSLIAEARYLQMQCLGAERHTRPKRA